MGNFKFQLGIVVGSAIISIAFMPIYFMRRKMQRMAETDLKKIDYEDWKKQVKSNAYVKLISRTIWGLFLIGWLIYNYQRMTENGVDLLAGLIFMIGIIYLVLGFFGYKNEMKKLRMKA